LQHRRKSSSLKKQDYYSQEEDPPAAKEVQVVKEDLPPAVRIREVLVDK
jgi:hypothetical protein